MPEYKYKSVDLEGKPIGGLATATDEESLASLLQGQGLTLVEADLVTSKEDKESASRSSQPAKTGRVKKNELIRFTYNFHAIVSSGVPLVRGLEALAQEAHEAESPLAPVLEGIIQRLKQGEPLADALALYPKAFPELYVNLVAAGEVSGSLEAVLLELAKYLEWQEDIKSNVKQATVYPIVVLTAVFGLIFLILTFVIPQFTEVFSKLRIELPMAMRILIATGNIAAGYWHLILLGIASAIIGATFWARTKTGKKILGRIQVKVPLFGSVIMRIALSRFTRNLSLLTNAGITLTEGLEITEKVAGVPDLEDGIRGARERVERGERLAAALSASPAIPLLVRHMVAVGEESGKLAESLERVSTFYDREVKLGLRRAFSILEPALTVVLAAVVGGIAIAIVSTLYKAITLVAK